MPRRPRIHLDGVPLHIVQRGHNRQPCFFAVADYRAYLEWLDEAARRTSYQIHGYALMTNHVHLLLTPVDAQSVSRLMVALDRRYVPYINASYHRSGTLWEGRYKSSLIQSEAYLMSCMRYIELNPVRAGMRTDPAHYRWSSYRANALGETASCLTKPEMTFGWPATRPNRWATAASSTPSSKPRENDAKQNPAAGRANLHTMRCLSKILSSLD